MHLWGIAATSAAVETLETRRLLSIAFVAKTGVLIVTGTGYADDVSVRADARLVNVVDVVVQNPDGRATASVNTAKLRKIYVVGGSGDDTITVDATLARLAADVTVNIDAGKGADVVASSLNGTVRLGDGNDRYTRSGGVVNVGGDGGDDVLDLGDGNHTIAGGAGDDRITARRNFWSIDAGDGDDRIAAPGLTGPIDCGAGDDRVTLSARSGTLSSRSKRPKPLVLGHAGNDTLSGASDADAIYGGDGDDRLYAGDQIQDYTGSTNYEPDTLNGEDGDDELSANGVRSADLSGGDGDDHLHLVNASFSSAAGGDGDDTFDATGAGSCTFDGDAGDDAFDLTNTYQPSVHCGNGADVVTLDGSSYAGVYGGDGKDTLDATGSRNADLYGEGDVDRLVAGDETEAYGGDGKDKFVGDDWQIKAEGDKPPYSGGYTGGVISTAVDVFDGLATVAAAVRHPQAVGDTAFALEPLDDVGYVVRAGTGDSDTGRDSDVDASSSGRPAEFAPIYTNEIKRLRNGVVRLPGGWDLSPESTKSQDVVWFNVRFGSGGNKAKSTEFGTVYQLCVKPGTIVVTSDGAYTSAARRIDRVRAGAGALRFVAGDIAQIAGAGAKTYRVGTSVLSDEGLLADDRYGVLVDGGVLYIADVDDPARFAPLS